MDLTATPNANRRFARWLGATGCDRAGVCSLPLSGNTTITAAFEGGATLSDTDLSGNAGVYDLVAYTDDSLIVLSSFTGTIDLGDGDPISEANGRTFLAKFSSTGSLTWKHVFPTGGQNGNFTYAQCLTVSGGDIVCIGGFSDAVDFGSGPVDGNRIFSPFLARFAAESGALVWLRTFSPTGTTLGIPAVGTDGTNLYVAITYDGALTFDSSHTLPSTASDTVLVKYGATNSPPNVTAISAVLGGSIETAATASDGTTALVFRVRSTSTQFGASFYSSSQVSHAVGWLSTSFGQVDSRGFASLQPDLFKSVRDAGKNLVITGRFQGTTDLGKGSVAAGAFGSVFVAKYDASHNPVFANSYACLPGDLIQALGVDSDSDIFFAGSTHGSAGHPALDFGGGSLSAEDGVMRNFATKLNPAGTYVWSRLVDFVPNRITGGSSSSAWLSAIGDTDWTHLSP